jgi:NAD(P)-dependent dehydrogenase (short-subunit alcohol dehydrogenase family)
MGLAVVERLLEQGWNVSIVDENSKSGEAIKDRSAAQTVFFEANVADCEQQSRVFDETWDKWETINLETINLGELLAML